MNEVSVRVREEQPQHEMGEPNTTEVVQREWLSYRESETFSGLSRTTLWKAIAAKQLKAAKVGRAVRISKASLQAYMEHAADTCGKDDGKGAKDLI